MDLSDKKILDVSGEKKITTVLNEIAQNLKVADEDASFRYDESARNIVLWRSV